jgi:uncharacterized cupredoxin-like copper-binding protein
MKARMLILAALALTPIAVYAHDDAHQGMMQGMMPGMMHAKAEGGHSEDGGHAQGVGKPGDPKKVSRAIQVVMSDDMKFTPANISVKRGETIKFVVKNAGQIKHEMVIGSMAELKQHAEMMRKMPGMEHADPNQVTLDPGKTGELVWQFTEAGMVDFACLQPGHFEAGMMGKISVK